MKALPKKCPLCGGSLKPGFLRDLHDHRAHPTSWVEGPVERSFLTGVKVRGRARAEIQALRCDACGRLEMYAPLAGA